MVRHPDEQEAIEKLRQKKSDYVTVFSTPAGKRVLDDLEKICFINKTTFSEIPGKGNQNEGMRFVVVHIKNMMAMDINTLSELSREGE